MIIARLFRFLFLFFPYFVSFFGVFVEIHLFWNTAKIGLPPDLISLLGWSFMKSPSKCVDSSATESEEYSESETEDYLMCLGEEQRVCIGCDQHWVKTNMHFPYHVLVEARWRTIKRSSKAVQNVQRKSTWPKGAIGRRFSSSRSMM